MPAPLAVLPAPQDTALPTGKRARMWTAQRGWIDGYLMRFRPATDQQCLAVYAPSMSGALLVAEIDSLQVDEYRGFGRRPPTPEQIAAAPPPVWQAVSVPALRSRELHCNVTGGLDSGHAAAFDRLDRAARTLIWTVQCAQRSAYARSSGRFGTSDSLGQRGACLRQDGRLLGVSFTPDSTFSSATPFRVVDLAEGARYLGAVDTAAVLNEARATSHAIRIGYEAFEKADRPFAPLSFRSDGDSIQVWLVPAELFMSQAPSAIGGERGFVYGPDGRTLAREIDAFERHRAIAIPTTGRVEIASGEGDLPLMSEMILVSLLHRRGRDVQLVTKAFVSQLVGDEPNAMWVHMPRR